MLRSAVFCWACQTVTEAQISYFDALLTLLKAEADFAAQLVYCEANTKN